MKLLVAVSMLLAVASCASLSLEDLEFHAWKLQFGKFYSSPSEESQRKQTWLSNRKLVLVHNMLADQEIKSYRLGMTYFADMENEEYKQLIARGCLKSFNSSALRHGSAFLTQPEATDLPPFVDWRDKGYVTKVRDQKDCGSCWAFSATGSLEGQTFRKTGKLVALSKQQLVDCSGDYGNMGCNGGLMDRAFDYIIASKGLDTEDSYPYEAEDGECRFNPDTVGATCSGYTNIQPGDEEALQKAVATVGPVSIVIDSSHSSFQLYQSGVYDEPKCSSTKLDHGVLVVGYGRAKNQDYWLVKNSWGLSWGSDGYIQMSRNKQNQCGVATVASYPLV